MNKSGKKGLLLKIILAFIFLAIIVGGISAWQVYKAIYRENTILQGKSSAYFYIHTGWKAEDVYNALYSKGYVKDKNIFEWLAEKKNYPNNVHPGKYRLKKQMSHNEIINLLRSGKQEPIDLLIENLHSLKNLASRAGKQLEADSSDISKECPIDKPEFLLYLNSLLNSDLAIYELVSLVLIP